mgnify:CR=1 FL=1
MNRKVALIDIDGCLTEYPNPKFFEFIKNETGKNFDDLVELKNTLGEEYEKFKSLYRQSGIKKTLELKEDALNTLNLIKKLKYDIYITTSRPNRYDVVADTHFWLQTNSVPYDDIFFTGDKSIFHFCCIGRQVLVVDDEYKNLSNYKNKENTLIFHFSDSRENVEKCFNYHHVKNWKGIAKIVMKNEDNFK